LLDRLVDVVSAESQTGQHFLKRAFSLVSAAELGLVLEAIETRRLSFTLHGVLCVRDEFGRLLHFASQPDQVFQRLLGGLAHGLGCAEIRLLFQVADVALGVQFDGAGVGLLQARENA